MTAKGADLTIYRKPFWTDWLFIIGLLVTFAFAIPATVAEYKDPITGNAEITGNEVAFAIDLGLRSAFYFLILGLVPAWIRLAIRRRRYEG